jgi:hypothetical protein
LLVVGAAIVVGGLFAPYFRSEGSFSGHAEKWLFEAIPLVAWATGAALIATARPRPMRAGTVLAAASLWITAGLQLAALGQLVSTGFRPAKTGFWLFVAGDAVAIVAVGVALSALRRSALLAWPASRHGRTGNRWSERGRWLHGGLTALALVVGAAAVVGYLPGWRHYQLTARTLDHPERLSTPGPMNGAWEVIAAQVLVVAALGLGPLVASRCEDLRAVGAAFIGLALGVGGLMALNAGDVITATPRMFVEASAVRTLDVRLAATVTGAFWLESAAVAVLVVTGLALVVMGDRAGARWRRGSGATPPTPG